MLNQRSAVAEVEEGLRFTTRDQDALWMHMFKKCVVRLGSREVFLNRAEVLADIEEKVLSGAFEPEIHGHLCSSKTSGVARFIPVQNYETTSVYFACVRVYDEACADLAVENTYGGWTLGGRRRRREEEEAKKLYEEPLTLDLFENESGDGEAVNAQRPDDGEADPDDLIGVDVSTSVPTSPYNKAAWFENWQEFWKILAIMSEREPENAIFVSFDVANFYDTVDLRRLRSKLEGLQTGTEDALRQLMALLVNSRTADGELPEATTGIPQDVVGDSSRVLANFYLVEFDGFFKEAVESGGGKYVRWADDVTFTCPSEAQVEPLLYAASQKLHSMGLNINAGKVKIRSREEFNRAWGFDVMDQMLKAESIEEGLAQLRDRWPDRDYTRKDTALRSALRLLRERDDLGVWRQWAYQTALSVPGFVQRLDPGKLLSLITISEQPDEATRETVDAFMGSPFTEPKCNLLRFLESQRNNAVPVFSDRYRAVRRTMLESGHPVLEQAARHSPYEGQR